MNNARLSQYKNIGRLSDRKEGIREKCKMRLLDLRKRNIDARRGNLTKEELTNVVWSAVNEEDAVFDVDEQMAIFEAMFAEIEREMLSEDEQYMKSLEAEELDWISQQPVPCPRCGDSNLQCVAGNASCGNCLLTLTHPFSTPYELFCYIQNIEHHHKRNCPRPLQMALYDDDDDDVIAPPPPKKEVAPAPVVEKKPAPSAPSKISMQFLQSQIQYKRNSERPAVNMHAVPTVVLQPKPLSSGVIDLTGRARAVPLKPVVAKAVHDSSLPMFINKAALDDDVNLFGEITITKEYQPALPNDYHMFKKKREEQELREKAAREVAERLEREHKEEMKKREMGAAFAPPSSLIEEEPFKEPESAKVDPPKWNAPAPFKMPFAQTGRGLGVAANIMSKMGYREGSGLGRDEQGISSAIQVERKGHMGKIVAPEAPQAPMSQQAISDAMRNATKVVMLTNMVTVDEVDDELEPEITEEMTKYGQVNSVVIHKMDEDVRIFVEFTNVAQAIKAFIVQSGRFFAGRPVQAAFYNIDDFNSKNYEA